ncbi:MAG TPA: SDR family NAD(P)-dependent oxidoreductase [Balneolales bacterium]|nr:SDR family NAD(P)-dependent oxidoreductase [Balneolales bacterium]
MKDKVILIVGAGGIGLACAKLFAQAGAKIVIAAHTNRKEAEKVATGINDNGGEAYVTEVEVTELPSVAGMVNNITEQLGTIDVLINAFGKGVIKPLLDIHPDEAKDVIDTNLYGTFLITQTVLRYMETKKEGNVVMFPGILGKYAIKNSSVYSATKFALTGFTKALVEETRRTDIKFSLFYLGSVDTPFWDDDHIDMKVRRDKMLSPDEVAKSVYYALTQPQSAVLNEIVIQPQASQMI